MVLATSDAVFGALCKRALEGGPGGARVVLVSPRQVLETARKVAHDVLLLDVDGEDVADLKALAAKAMLVSEARIVLTSGYLSPGAPGLTALLQSIAATFVQKPQGRSSLGLADEDGPPFVAALQAALASEGQEPAVDD